MLSRKKHSDIPKSGGDVIDIQWGGYYTSKENGKFGIFRLLDFNKSAYHIQLFQEKFDHAPSFEEIKDLQPFIWHAPIASASLLNRDEPKLIGHKKLDEQSLMGYEEYLRQMGVDEAGIKTMIGRLMQFSSEAPLRVKLTESSDGVIVTPIE